MKGQIRQARRIKAAFFAVALAVLTAMLPAGTAFAQDGEEPYYSTWAEYQASGNPSSTWNNVADAMDAVFDKGIEYFEAGDMDNAYDCVNDGYYGYYETTGFERIAMGYISGSRKTEVELQFSACKAVCKNSGTLEEFQTEIEELKSMIHHDANILDGTSGDEDESSNSSDGSDSTSTSSSSTSNAAAVAAFSACFLRVGF